MIDEKKLTNHVSNYFMNKLACLSIFKITRKRVEQIVKTSKDIIDIINAQPKTDWIPCEERWPEANEDVLVYTEYGEMRVYSLEMRIIEGNFGRYEWKDSYGYWQELETVEAWQPLPAPYKKEGAENE